MFEPRRDEYVHRVPFSGSTHPFQIHGNFMYGFVFPANLTSLERLVDTHLNRDPSGAVAYAPFAPYVLFGFSTIDFVQGAVPPYSEYGGGYEHELAIWVPVRRRGSLAPMLFTPYIFVNNPYAVVQGREVYGFPKEMAWLHKNRWPERFPVDAFAVETHRGRAKRHWTRVLSVERAERGPRRERHWGSFREAAGDLRFQMAREALLPSVDYSALPLAALNKVSDIWPALGEMLTRQLSPEGWVGAAMKPAEVLQSSAGWAMRKLWAFSPLSSAVWPPNAPLVFRKQFPDCDDISRSCYEAIVEADLNVTSFDYGSLLEDQYVVRFPESCPRPLADDLGLSYGTRSVLGYEMRFDFRLEAGRESWVAPRAGSRPSASFLAQARDLAAAVPRRIVDLGVSATQTLAASLTGAGLPPPRYGKKEKIAILGGGVGAMVSAFALTEAPDWKKRYDITVYQIGWRLGGKGANGRNKDHGERIEEHGLHIWFGFYENAFRVIRRCYRAMLGGDADSKYEDPILWGFEPDNFAVLEHEFEDGSYGLSPLHMPPHPGWPGAEDDGESPTSIAEYVVELLRWLAQVVGDSQALAAAGAAHPLTEGDWAPLRERMGDAYAEAQPHPVSLLGAVAELAQSALAGSNPSESDGGLLELLFERILLWLQHSRGADGDDRLARQWRIVVDLGVTVVRGLFKDGAIFNLEKLDDWEFMDWLRHHGAHEETVDSEFLRALYAVGFGFENGDIGKPRGAAGVTIRCTMRFLFGYRKSFFFRMKSGMGDIIFAPLYEVLRKRGVKFHFFHRVDRLELSADRKSIERIHMGRQATPLAGYRLLEKVKDYRCWPDRPDYDHLREGEEILALQKEKFVNLESLWSAWGPNEDAAKVTLRRGKQFHRVILGISIAALPRICADLAAADPRWKNMFEKVKTVRTQASQLWLNTTPEENGWRYGPALVSGSVQEIDTWGDWTHTLGTEDWPVSANVKQIAYFCGVMPDDPDEPPPFSDPDYPVGQRKRVIAEMRKVLAGIGRLWPDAVDAQGFKWDRLVGSGSGDANFLEQWFVANIDPTERYVLSVPGSTTARLRSDESGFDNLYLAGDWTYTGLSAGCVEAATMSGLRAARAIGGWPERIVGEEHFVEPAGSAGREGRAGSAGRDERREGRAGSAGRARRAEG